MAAVAGYNSSVLVTSPPSVSTTYILTNDAGDHMTYVCATASQRYWDPSASILVHRSLDGGTTFSNVSPSEYTIKYVNGTIIFAVAQQQTPDPAIIKVDANYYPYSTLGNAHTAEFSGKVDMEDTTVFNTTGTHSYTPCLMSGTLKLSQWWINETLLTNLTNRALLVVSFVSPTGARYEGFCYVSDSDLKNDVKKVPDESLTFQLTNQFFAN